MADEQKPKIEGIYTALVNVRNTELSVYYARYNIQAVINFGLIAAVLAAREDSKFLTPLPLWIVLGGLALSMLWLCFVIWGKRLFTRRWESYLREYEIDILAHQCLKNGLLMFTDVKDKEEKLRQPRRYWDNLTILNVLVPLMASAAWMIIGYLACHSALVSLIALAAWAIIGYWTWHSRVDPWAKL